MPVDKTLTFNTRVTLAKDMKHLITGTGTAGQDKGEGVSPRYIPSVWTFNVGLTAIDGDIITIRIPAGGSPYGVYVSIDNGTTYYPVVSNGSDPLKNEFAVGTCLQLILEASGNADGIYPRTGGNEPGSVTGGVWSVLNFYSEDLGPVNERIDDILDGTTEIPFIGNSMASASFNTRNRSDGSVDHLTMGALRLSTSGGAQFSFVELSKDSTTGQRILGAAEQYFLPACDDDRSSAVRFDIVTTKDMSEITEAEIDSLFSGYL